MTNTKQEVKTETRQKSFWEDLITLPIPGIIGELFPAKECECGTGFNYPSFFSFKEGLIYPECGVPEA